MMGVEHYRELFAYDAWANRRVWDCLEPLSDEQFTRDLGYSVGSLRTQTVHTMANQSFWIHFLTTGEVRHLDYADFPSRPVIRAAWDQVERDTHAYLDTMMSGELERTVLPGHWAARSRAPFTVRQGLSQLINHNTDHRAQTLAGIDRLGGETIAQDYLFFVWEAASGHANTNTVPSHGTVFAAGTASALGPASVRIDPSAVQAEGGDMSGPGGGGLGG
jgi:uncharacterized damage-inducible protein DinB